MPASAANSEGGWLGWLCLTRASFALIFTAYSAAITFFGSMAGGKR